ncbi:type II toxin-antitoxin system mRNA interferase toxin, RelE/StbE family [Iningainema tapete]|uniref:Type II toxin-antitoxin system RelE/ParE family toxin n=1 Tax=Iningainema tapete BLCC-T55 TaxID=2748662 RepID=A0A8J7BWX9_9CYAN|nr:type II toxin-antitoxin system RelE/ParE family toxin [Iningainema tapete BLCC-T55]
MTYQIDFSRTATKQLNKLPSALKERIEAKILELADNPRPHGITKLKNRENGYRIKVGDYRILYDIYDGILVITVVKVGHRREVYRDE